MNILISFVVLLSFFLSEHPVTESNSLFEELERELFRKESETQFLYKYLTCQNTKIDSTISVRVQQPDPEKVLSLLGKIMNSKDSTAFVPLKTIYLKHMDNFIKEWSKAYKDNYYACGQIQEQFNILKGFETALKALDFQKSNYTSKQIFDFYVDETLLNKRLLMEISNRKKLFQEFQVYSDEFRKIRSKAWFCGNIPFHYLDPFFTDLKPFFIELMEDCDWNTTPQNNSCIVSWSSRYFYSKISDQRISDYFIRNYDSWKTNNRQAFIYEYAGIHFFPELTTFLTREWIKKDSLNKPLYRHHQIRLLLKNENNLSIVMNQLLEASDTQPEQVKMLLDFLPKPEALEYLKSAVTNSIKKESIQNMILQLESKTIH